MNINSCFTRIKNQVYTMIACWNMLSRALKATFLQEKFKNHQKIISHSDRKSLIFLHYHWIFEMMHTLIWVSSEDYFWCKIKLRWHILWYKGKQKWGARTQYEFHLRNWLQSFVACYIWSKPIFGNIVPPFAPPLPPLFWNFHFSNIYCLRFY